ncbi:MAG: DUF488 domain-containing protein, partial [Eubacteriales bacterium]
YTMGFTQKSAKDFFTLLKDNNIMLLVDIRLNNASQLAGFTKGRDLKYFLEEFCSIEYVYEPLFAPTKYILDSYKNGKMSWQEYEIAYINLLQDRKAEDVFNSISKKGYSSVCFLCSELKPTQCHRRLLAEYLKENIGNINIKHI